MSSSGFAISITAVDGATKVFDGLNKRIAALSAPAERFNKSMSKFGEISGLRRVSEGIKEVGRTSLDAFRSLDRMAAPLAAITGAASIAGVVEMTRRWGEFGNRLQQLGYRLSVPVDRLTSLEGAARLAGSSAGALDSGLRSLGDTLTGATFGRDPHAVQLFNSLGVAFKDANGNARESVDVLGEVADAIQKLPDPRTQARVTRELFGGEELLPLLRRGRAGIAEYTAEVQRLGGVVTPEMADRASKLWHSIGELEIAAGGVAHTIADKLAPRITDLNERLATWAARNRDVIGSGLLEWLGKIGAWFERHPQLAGAMLGAAAGYKIGGPIGGVVGAAGGGWLLGSPLPADLGNTPSADQPFSWSKPWTWLHHSPAPGRAITVPTGPTNAAAVMRQTAAFWKAKGFSDAQVAGILAGGPAAESGFNPAAVGDNGSSYGLYQEHNDRMRGLMARFGPAPTVEQQNEYAWSELNDPQQRNMLAALHGARTPEEAARIWTTGFERPAGGAAEADRRAAAASQFQGHVQVDVSLKNAPPGTTARVTASGPVTAPPARIETPMPMVN